MTLDNTTLDDATAATLDIDPLTRDSINGLLARMTVPEREQAEQIRGILLAELGTFSVSIPDLPETSPAAWVAGVLGAAPTVREWMLGQGIDESAAAATLADVGRHLRLHRRHTGTIGFDAPRWMLAVLSGSLVQLGRLQFDLRRWRTGESTPPVQEGPWVLDVHIPESGPLNPDAVQDSFTRAVGCFDRYFPDKPARLAVCASWLLDPYLGEHLPPASNMVAFQRLFTPYGQPKDDELDAMYFTFGQRSLDNLDRLPRESSLQRLVLDRVQHGEQWQVVHGYRAFRVP